MKAHSLLRPLLLFSSVFALFLSGCSTDDSSSSSSSSESTSSQQTSTSDGSSQKGIIAYSGVETTVYSSTAEVVKAVADSVVEITTETITTSRGRQYTTTGAGSGVLFASKENTYYVVTNHHVIDEATVIGIKTRAGVTYEGTLLASDDQADIAVVTITSETALTMATWGDSDQLQVGEDVIAIGNPLGSLGGTVTKGILSATGRQITISNYEMTLLQTDASINPGNSGGGLFNMRGELIGVVNAKNSNLEIEGICFAIPANSAKNACENLLEYGYIPGRSTLDIELASATMSNGTGQTTSIVYVTSVGEKASSSFRQIDRISKINDTEISSILDFNMALSAIPAGTEITVEVYRGSLYTAFFSTNLVFEEEPTTFQVTTGQYGA